MFICRLLLYLCFFFSYACPVFSSYIRGLFVFTCDMRCCTQTYVNHIHACACLCVFFFACICVFFSYAYELSCRLQVCVFFFRLQVCCFFRLHVGLCCVVCMLFFLFVYMCWFPMHVCCCSYICICFGMLAPTPLHCRLFYACMLDVRVGCMRLLFRIHVLFLSICYFLFVSFAGWVVFVGMLIYFLYS